jgi:transcriptional regulator with XRE-family HTH domain
MASGHERAAVRLARRLRDLREREWPDVTLTQAELAAALGSKGEVKSGTLSSWESLTNPKTPTPARLTAYARFFATRRSVAGKPHLLTVDEFTDEERGRFEQLEKELLDLRAGLNEEQSRDETGRRALLSFDDSGPVVIICPEAPQDSRGPLADPENANHTRLHKFADADSLLEVFGHIRALNPTLPVLARLPSEVPQAELQNHTVLLGGVAWNRTIRRILSHLESKLPIEQIDDARVRDGDVFRVKKDEHRKEQIHLPVIEVDDDGESELIEDVGLIARLPNPFNFSRSMTICNGIFSKGVLGAVLAITDETVRPANERYLAQRFPAGDFAMLVRVPVVSGTVLAPDLQNPDTRLFEWSPEPAAGE